MSLQLQRLTAAGAALALGLVAAPAFATTAINGNINLTGRLALDAATAEDHGRDAWSNGGATFAPNAQTTDGIRDLATGAHPRLSASGVNAAADGTIAAHWDGANSGTVQTDYSVDFGAIAGQFETIDANFVTPNDPDWVYAFQATADGTFNLSSDIRGFGDSQDFGEWSLDFFDNGVTETIGLGGHFLNGDPHNTANVARDLIAGHTYVVTLRNNDNFGISGIALANHPAIHGAEQGRFSWSIVDGKVGAAVPEPGSWALAILGLGMAGAVLRRRGTAVASPL